MRVPKESRTLHCLNFSQAPRKAASRFSYPSQMGANGKGERWRVESCQPSIVKNGVFLYHETSHAHDCDSVEPIVVCSCFALR